MNTQAQKKMLLALDGSEYALETVKYISKIPAFQKMRVVLLNVMSKIPEYYWDLEREPQFNRRITDIRAWERQLEKNLEEYMGKARGILFDAGFPQDAVSVKTQERQAGIARDIVKEAKDGYYAIAVGRKGLSKLKDLILGSIVIKLLEKLTFVPLFVVGINPQPGKVLLALDTSEGSMRAVDYLGSTLGESDLEVSIIHVIRGEKRAWIEDREAEIEPVFNMSKSHLMSCGFDSDQITTKTITGVQSRANAIVKEAKDDGYGTIVVGRRGLSKARDFFMGRVSNKVIQLAEGKAVCVVS